MRDARVVLGQVATIPWLSAAAAGKAAVEGAEPMTDNGYKVDLVTSLVRRAVASLG